MLFSTREVNIISVYIFEVVYIFLKNINTWYFYRFTKLPLVLALQNLTGDLERDCSKLKKAVVINAIIDCMYFF